MLGVLRWTLPWMILAASLLSVGASWQVEHAFGDDAFTSSGVLEDGIEASALHIASSMHAMLQETTQITGLSTPGVLQGLQLVRNSVSASFSDQLRQLIQDGGSAHIPTTPLVTKCSSCF